MRGELRGWWERGRALGAANPLVVDIGVALLVQFAMTMPFVVPRVAGAPPATWAAYGLSTLGVLPLVWRRRAPVAVLFAVLAANALYRLTVDGPGQPLPYTGLVVVYTIAALSPARKRLVTGLVLLVAVPVGVWLNTRSARELTFSVFVFAAAYVLGRLTDARQRAHRVEAEQAAARERARIAREMHDILSHAVSLMIVQAEAGPVAVRAAPERAEAAFEAISETGRDAMAQLRRMLGVLRESDGESGRRSAGGSGCREPQPGVAELPGLCDRVRAGSGLEVVYRTAGTVRPLPGAVAATVFRVVQEALTNTVRHAGARTVTVQVTYGDGDLCVRVTDDGRGPQAGAAGRRGGHGLVGIRERAAALGGSAVTGRGADGRGFEVRVLLPVPAGAEAGR
ncbi:MULTISPECIES: sensor histidine kinase [Streptomyces]|uniref:histidine kinase n=1 Tax=Streptomyces chartreusis NRRL 3882 TaxID=1079985 RepID=A0A2N9BAL3_STRCX|nr:MULTISPECIES: histidine kinase [Streptomyces]MYS91290.1 two-component sensor histidine kinase [Streptomyces sp. SID5464]SOR80391.1 Sensor histidine kinase LiaS [Streptomyces chartreusis NRRL 3882]